MGGAVAVALLLLSGYAATKHINSVPFVLGVAAAFVFLLCALDALLFPPDASRGFLKSLGGGLLRGGLIAFLSWLGMMLSIPLFADVGDKFPLFVVAIIPFAIAFGAVVGGLARGVSHRLRCRQI